MPRNAANAQNVSPAKAATISGKAWAYRREPIPRMATRTIKAI